MDRADLKAVGATRDRRHTTLPSSACFPSIFPQASHTKGVANLGAIADVEDMTIPATTTAFSSCAGSAG